MRVFPDSTASPLTIEAPVQQHQPSSFLSLIQQPSQPVHPYSSDLYHSNNGHLSYGLGPRLGSSNTSNPAGHMAHAHRSTTLPQPGPQLTRDLYSTATPAFRRVPEHHSHAPRSPSFPGLQRRHPLSPTPSPHVPFAPIRMDAGYGQKAQANLPPLNAQTNLGVLTGVDGTTVKFDINGSIDKGFFLADNEWTCYRRNYFSCICSFTLNPDYHGQQMQFTVGAGQSGQVFPVHGFAMSISAMVADNDTHSIDLVQHTPKRDKGPVAKPDKVRLSPKAPQAPGAYGQLGMYGQADTGLPSSRPYDQGFGQAQTALPTEHTFERIQFKQATANNGKRRAAQQFYHLIIELYADAGEQSPQQWIKMGYRKSAKMIVRGRSPGHYQSERRGSSGSGPSTGSGLGDGSYGGNMMGAHFGGGPTLMTNAYGNGGYDPRHGYSGRHHQHHHDMPMEPVLSAEEDKKLHETKGYQYYPTPIYEGEHDTRNPVEVFHHNSSSKMDTDNTHQQHHSTSHQLEKVKGEYESGVSNVWYPGGSYYAQNCGRFEGKSSSSGFYPSMMAPTAALNI